MNKILLDTHAIIWYLLNSPHLSQTALQTIEKADKIYISIISVIEIIYLQEKGRISQEALTLFYQNLEDKNCNWYVYPCDLGVAKSMEKIDRNIVPEMPDRIITATALYLDIPLITRDSKINKSIVKTIW